LEHSNWDRLNIVTDTKKAFKNYNCFSLRHLGLFLIHLQSKYKAAPKYKATLGNASKSKPKRFMMQEKTV